MTPITRQDILAYQAVVPWSAQYQVEQDLLLCRAMTALFDDAFLSSQIAMRGGTLLHKVHLAPASRYSEDIDLVVVGNRPEEHIRRAIRRVLADVLGPPKTSVWGTLTLAIRNAVKPSKVLRMATLVTESIGTMGAQLLWVPPSLPYYPLDGAFKKAAGFSKTLVFSGWVMVPRMIATLLSYEVERRTIGNRDSQEDRETKARKYFPPRNKPNYRRHPVPLLVYRTEDGDAALARSLSNFCCLFPSPTLAGLYDPIPALADGLDLPKLRQTLRTRIALADRAERKLLGKCELVPYWHMDAGEFKIERIIPLYPFSRDHGKLAAILKTLAIYRLAFGQPRQVELIEHLLQKKFSPEEIESVRKNLMINLSPICYNGDLSKRP